MKPVISLIFWSITINSSLGQNTLTKVNYENNPNLPCMHVALGSGFEKSGMAQYVARPRIIESKWLGHRLNIKIFVVSDCCPPDYLGYMVHSDTLKLYYGDEKSIPDKNGEPKEIDICMCGPTGCCYEFEYVIDGLNANRNYLVTVSDVLGIGSRDAYPVGYTDSSLKSIHYSTDCNSFKLCLDNKIDEAISHYKKLGPLYDSLLALSRSGGPAERKMVDGIKNVWIKYFECREAIHDKFIESKLGKRVHNGKLTEFEAQVSSEVKLLTPRLDIVSKYLHGGAFLDAR